MRSARSEQGGETAPREFDVRWSGPTGPLLGGVEHVESLGKLCDVDHAMLDCGVDTNFPHPRSDGDMAFQSEGSSPH